ncbi:hypothetical protein L6452_15046 [Arctium lappa]|uniref:Uncharacterized protein n=1 Tax=Arctium lappa TaxID=4217 RepID=A0ACB9CMP4_ARCLA|nr:hypothetical protein L6452_15046 [Arctium lappa]
MIARRKPTKKLRLVEEEAEKVAEEEEAPESSTMKEPASTKDVKMYMVVMDKVPEPISAEPVGVKPPKVIHWDVLEVDGKDYIRLKRKDEKYEVYNTWNKIVRTSSRSDIEEMFEIGMKLYADELKAPVISITKLIMEYLCMMFKPDEVEEIIRNVFQTMNNWTLYETSGVYAVTLDLNHTEYFLVDRMYNHSILKLHAMLKKNLGYSQMLFKVRLGRNVQSRNDSVWGCAEDSRDEHQKLAMEYLCMMFSPDLVKHVIKDVFKSVGNWMLIERCGVYILTIDKRFHEYYLVDKIYDHSLAMLQRMLKAKLSCSQGSEMARIVVWVPKIKKVVSTSTSNSTADRNSVATNVSAANRVSTANLVSSASSGNQQVKGKSIWHVDSGCSRHMTGNKSCLQNFKRIDGGHVSFGDNPSRGKISGKGNVSKGKMTFEDVYYVKQLRYNLLSVSQGSRFTWVYFLRTKDEISGLIKSFVLRIENQTNLRVKVIRSDNGTEFKNNDLNNFCEEKGIKKQYISPRAPQQNGIAVRRNRTLIEAARSLYENNTGTGTESVLDKRKEFVLFPISTADPIKLFVQEKKYASYSKATETAQNEEERSEKENQLLLQNI